MSKFHRVSLPLTVAVVAIPALATLASAAPAEKSYVVYGNDGQAIGQAPHPSVRMPLRDQSPGNRAWALCDLGANGSPIFEG